MKIIYYYHIPKCGGATIKHSLREIAKSKGAEFYSFSHSKPKLGVLRKWINNFKFRIFLNSINNQTTTLKIVHHHHGYYGIGEIGNLLLKKKAKAKLFILLRQLQCKSSIQSLN